MYFAAHIAVLMVGLLCLVIAACTAFMYMLAYRQLKSKRIEKKGFALPPLETLDQRTAKTLYFGFLFLTLGIVSGVFLAHQEWKSNWMNNPKFIFSFVTWIWYLVLILLRHVWGFRGGRFAVLIWIGLVFLLITFVGSVSFFQMAPHRWLAEGM